MSISPVWPDIGPERGVGYWLRASNDIAGRRHFRTDHSNEWRYERLREGPPPPPGVDPDPEARSRTVSWLLDRPVEAFRCVILGDTGEGDHSQYALLPVIRALHPDFLIINGDVAYPAGRSDDYDQGFFRPYRGLGVPIWTVPGNHDYYSAHRGREYFEIFCGETRRATWEAAGLRLKPQPGVFWELAAPGGQHPLILLGVDSGHSGDLEGTRGGGILGLGRKQARDTRQLDWLEWRLRVATAAGARVIVLYHIPALVRGEHKKEIRLDTIHRLVARFPAVRLVITAHEHNYQRYDPGVFGRYLAETYRGMPAAAPTYLVSGAGGAYISATDFKGKGYPPVSRYPTADDWSKWAPLGLRLVAKAGLDKSFLNRIAIGIAMLRPGIAEDSDADRPERLSLLVLDHDPATGTRVQPYFVDDLLQLYPQLPDGTEVQIVAPTPLPDPAALAACAREQPIVL